MRLGKLSSVDLRSLWTNEASDFTPWLAKEDNIKLLGDTIGLDLEVVEEEMRVGNYSADIVCKNLLDDSYVLIENQLEKTDHTHLGQILTYAAGLDAVTIIWIAKKFTEEHRAAIDWLNHVTEEKIRFFGIELEVYQIGDSLPAPRFQMVSKPNDWTKAVHSAKKRSDLTETQELNLEYWTEFKKYIETQDTNLKCQKPQPQHWYNFAVGKSYFHISAISSVRDNFIRIDFNMTGDKAKERFDYLKEMFEEESLNKISQELVWDELDGKISSYVYLKNPANIDNRNEWESHFEWFVEYIEKFDSFFRPKIKNID